MKGIENPDDHLVVHDAVTVTVAAALGVAALAVTGDLAMAAATTSVLTAAGIGGMEVGPVRRTVNRTAMAVASVIPERGK